MTTVTTITTPYIITTITTTTPTPTCVVGMEIMMMPHHHVTIQCGTTTSGYYGRFTHQQWTNRSDQEDGDGHRSV